MNIFLSCERFGARLFVVYLYKTVDSSVILCYKGLCLD